MGFFDKLKEKLFNKKKNGTDISTKYVSGLDKSRKNFVDKLAELLNLPVAQINKVLDK